MRGTISGMKNQLVNDIQSISDRILELNIHHLEEFKASVEKCKAEAEKEYEGNLEDRLQKVEDAVERIKGPLEKDFSRYLEKGLGMLADLMIEMQNKKKE